MSEWSDPFLVQARYNLVLCIEQIGNFFLTICKGLAKQERKQSWLLQSALKIVGICNVAKLMGFRQSWIVNRADLDP